MAIGGGKTWARWLMVGAIGSLGSVLLSSVTQAQIIPDGTLSTQVSGACGGTGGTCTINGLPTGSNLFHSFQQFSLPNGDTANFITTPTIHNVIVRVTGIGQPFISTINGTIETSNPTNFFLLNPNGIVFSSGAHILVGGSFLASTAEQMLFQDGTVFDTHDQTIAPLLTVSVPIGLQMGQTPGAIQMQSSSLVAGSFLAGSQDSFSDFALIGGNITLQGTTLTNPGQRVELGGLSQLGVVGLNLSGNKFRLNYPEAVERADVSLDNNSSIDVRAAGGGNIAVHARNLTISGTSSLIAGIGSGLGTSSSQAGDIMLDTTGTIDINQSSFIENNVYQNATGNSGNIHVKAGFLLINSGAHLGTFVFGQGKAGDIGIDTQEGIALENTSPDGQALSGIFSDVESGAIGQGGNLRITSTFLSLANSAVIRASTFGIGNAGNINIQTSDQITLNQGAFIESNVQAFDAIGNGGNVLINADSIVVQNGSQINAFTRGQGNAGNVMIHAKNTITFDGVGNDGSSSGALSTVEYGGIGKGGNLTIDTQKLTITNGALVSVATAGQSANPNKGNSGNLTIHAADLMEVTGTSPDAQTLSKISADVDLGGTGNGGDLTIQTKRLVVKDGAEISATTFGTGNAGNLTVFSSDSVELSGESPNGSESVGYPSGLFAQVDLEGRGHGGNLVVQTEHLSVSDGSKVQAATFGDGDAGNLLIQANEVDVSTTRPTEFTAAINAGVSQDPRTIIPAKGNGGNLIIDTGKLSIQSTNAEGVNSAEVTVDTAGEGNAGNLLVKARDLVEVVGENSFLSAAVTQNAIGQAGDLMIEAQHLSVRDGGQVSASTAPDTSGNGGNLIVKASKTVEALNEGEITVSSQGIGNAGNLSITSPNIRLDKQGKIVAETRSGQGGNITLDFRDLLLMRHGSQISTTAGTAQAGGNGGNITINAPRGFLVSAPLENNDITANAFSGSGGRININAAGIYWFTFRSRADLVRSLGTPPFDPFRLPTNDITASSEFGVSGTVTLNTLNVDPSRGLQELPGSLTDPSRQIAQTCVPRGVARSSSFTVTGRGGLPDSPLEPLQSEAVATDWVTIAPTTANTPSGQASPQAMAQNQQTDTGAIVEAQGFVTDASGTEYLVAYTHQPTPSTAPPLLSPCPGR